MSRRRLFDIGADTVGLLVPGGSIAVKVARAALDKSYRAGRGPPALPGSDDHLGLEGQSVPGVRVVQLGGSQ